MKKALHIIGLHKFTSIMLFLLVVVAIYGATFLVNNSATGELGKIDSLDGAKFSVVEADALPVRPEDNKNVEETSDIVARQDNHFVQVAPQEVAVVDAEAVCEAKRVEFRQMALDAMYGQKAYYIQRYIDMYGREANNGMEASLLVYHEWYDWADANGCSREI